MHRCDLLALAFAASICGFTEAAGIKYTLKLSQGGEEIDPQAATLGEYTLEVWGETVDNEIFPDTFGGILQYSFDLVAPDGILFKEGASGPPFAPVPSGAWDSETVDGGVFSTNFRGLFPGGPGVPSSVVIAETGAIPPGNFDANFAAAGANEPTLLVSGPIIYDGGPTSITVSGNPAGHLLYADQGGGRFGGVNPEFIICNRIELNIVFEEGSTHFRCDIPEPSSVCLYAVGSLFAVCRPRQRRSRPT